jgi:hypothetical protein
VAYIADHADDSPQRVDHGDLSDRVLVGAGVIAISALRLPPWARLRERQMEAITTRLALKTAAEDPKQLP